MFNMSYQLSIIDINGNKHLIGHYAKMSHARYIDIKIIYNFDKNGYFLTTVLNNIKKGVF